MARYIDADKLAKNGWHLERCGASNVLLQSMSIADVPEADVVPKSEVEALLKENERWMTEYAGFRAGVKSIIENVKSEVAREIFEEIGKHYCINRFGEIVVYHDAIDELKKKYAESENG